MRGRSSERRGPGDLEEGARTSGRTDESLPHPLCIGAYLRGEGAKFLRICNFSKFLRNNFCGCRKCHACIHIRAFSHEKFSGWRSILEKL